MGSKKVRMLIFMLLICGLVIPLFDTANAADTGSLKVNTGIADVSVSLGGDVLGATSSWGDKQFDGLTEGVYTLRLSKAGYKDWTKQVSITVGKTTTVYAYLELGSGDSVTRSETVASTSPLGSLSVNAGQGDVNIYVGDEYGGATSSWSDATVNGLIDGTYTVKLTKPGYKEWNKQVKITVSKTTKVYAALEIGTGVMTTRSETIAFDSPLGTLQVESDWENQGAVVSVGGEYSGALSSFGSVTVNGLVAGSYSVKLEKSGFKSWTKQAAIANGKTTTVYVYLQAGTGAAATRSETIAFDSPVGKLTVESDWDNEGAVVYVSDEYSGALSTFGSRTVEGLLVGSYTLRLEKSGFKTWTKQFTIAVGQTTTAYAYLEPGTGTATTRQETIAYDSARGSLEVDVVPSGVNIYVGGEYGGNTGSWNSKQVEGLLEGTYTVTLTKTGYRDATLQVTIIAGQTAELSTELTADSSQPSPSSSPSTSPSNAPQAVVLSTSGSSQSYIRLSWSQNSNADFSKYEVFRSTSSGTLGSSVVSITNRTTTTYEVTGLNPSTKYYFIVRVWNTASQFSDSNQLSASTLATGATPTDGNAQPFLFDYSIIIIPVAVATVVIILVSVLAVYNRRKVKSSYNSVYAQAERERAEQATRERVERERFERERRRAEEERAREEQRRAESQRQRSQQDQRKQQEELYLRSLFDFLELPYNATRQQVKDRWRELSKWHPDRFADADERAKEMANEKWSKINAAYEEILRLKGWPK